MNYQSSQRQLAEEYVLGTLRGAARRRFEQLLQQDSELRGQADRVAARFNTLVELVEPLEPPDHVWQGIVRQLGAGKAEATVVPIKPGRSEKLWRGWAIAATLLLGVWLAKDYVLPPQPTPQAVVNEALVLIREDASQAPAWFIRADLDRQLLHFRALGDQPLPSDRVYQLWMKLPEEQRVRPVGLIPRNGSGAIHVAREIVAAVARAELFGVSLEPLGGSPTGQPTSKPLHHGQRL